MAVLLGTPSYIFSFSHQKFSFAHQKYEVKQSKITNEWHLAGASASAGCT